ncbi:UDP-galactopyranose mutase [Proteiniphilum acetatigenes]|uniref:UDP-galactopyranose mutase n=1 Tax=Proteiniphilum acetatigenes TaxID=294710 RepID=UPI000361C36B|nr:UDP-galactopyranose mutase [Proteiniphilum acetatigenes]SFL64041.1 UDP-galactopyranose mutase [Porphyromonadaceae bacterium KH3CP3RA]
MSRTASYDFLLVGAGLFNAVFANEATKEGKKCLVVEKRKHLGGNLYCRSMEGIQVHMYGPHIFHTNNPAVWNYVTGLTGFNHFINSPLARYGDKLYNLPFNMNTFYQLWNVTSPREAREKIEGQKQTIKNPRNLEEQALALCGRDIYEILIKGYTEKQWGKSADRLPAFIIKRIPIRYTYNNNYFNSTYQGIPEGGYNGMIEKCFSGCDVLLNCDFSENRELRKQASAIIYTGMIDAYYDYCYGALEYRSLNFDHELLDMENYQGNAVVNYTERSVPFTRIIEHKHFEFGTQPKTVITKEYPCKMRKGLEPYYPVNTEQNNRIFEKYNQLSKTEKNIFFGGRLGTYQYINMDETVTKALALFRLLFIKKKKQ